MEWISVKDKLPDEGGRYAVVIKNNHLPNIEPWTSCENFLAGGALLQQAMQK